MEELSNLSTTTLVVFGVLLVVQMTLLVIALLDLVRRSPEALLGGKKWPWALLVVLGSTIGPIIYLAVARKPHSADGPAGAPEGAAVSDTASAAVDLLYGDRTDESTTGAAHE
ncbi:MAG: PLD nuclease N-terminal domain-containing protein [Coriobacteriia bacterium]|nr:PLD nuclease N-terminal domain-containing protein [Coriobacteriia bacterium]